MKTKRDFLRISLDLLLIPAHARLSNYLNGKPPALLLSKIMLLNTVKKSMKGPVKIVFGQSKFHVWL